MSRMHQLNLFEEPTGTANCCWHHDVEYIPLYIMWNSARQDTLHLRVHCIHYFNIYLLLRIQYIRELYCMHTVRKCGQFYGSESKWTNQTYNIHLKCHTRSECPAILYLILALCSLATTPMVSNSSTWMQGIMIAPLVLPFQILDLVCRHKHDNPRR